MADTTIDSREPRDLAPDLIGVKSRVSWGAIVAGAVIAVACYIALTLLLAAIGVSLTDAGVRANSVAVGVLVAMIITMALSLFVGGWVAAQLTVGENRQEAALYGLLTWGVVTAFSVMIVGAGVRAGYFAVVGGAMVAQNERAPSFDDGMRQLGYTDAQIAEAKAKFTPAAVREAANNPQNQEAAREAAMYSAWTALVATMLSMAAAVGGALVGRGTAFRIFPVAAVRRDTGPRLIVPTA